MSVMGMLLLLLVLAVQDAKSTLPTPPARPGINVNGNITFDVLFSSGDTNHDGVLDETEFQDRMMKVVSDALAGNPEADKKFTPEQRAEMHHKMAGMFERADRNGDGHLTRGELAASFGLKSPSDAPQ